MRRQVQPDRPHLTAPGGEHREHPAAGVRVGPRGVHHVQHAARSEPFGRHDRVPPVRPVRRRGDGFVARRLEDPPPPQRGGLPARGGRVVPVQGEAVRRGEAGSDRAELRVWNVDGEEVERWRVAVEPPVVDDGDWARARDAELASIEDPGQRRETTDFFDEVPRPARHPAWGDLVVSTEGRPWLQRFAAPGVDEPALWWVFDEAGAVERVVRLPAGLDVMWIRGDTVAGIERDDLDVEYFRVYRLLPDV